MSYWRQFLYIKDDREREDDVLSSFKVIDSSFWEIEVKIQGTEECLNANVQSSILCYLNFLALPGLSESVLVFVLLDYSWFVSPVRCSVFCLPTVFLFFFFFF